MSDERTYCSHCNHVMKPYYARCPKCEGDRNREKVDALAAVIVELKRSRTEPIDPERKRELVRLLHVYNHPYADEFLQTLKSDVDAKGNRR